MEKKVLLVVALLLVIYRNATSQSSVKIIDTAYLIQPLDTMTYGGRAALENNNKTELKIEAAQIDNSQNSNTTADFDNVGAIINKYTGLKYFPDAKHVRVKFSISSIYTPDDFRYRITIDDRYPIAAGEKLTNIKGGKPYPYFISFFNNIDCANKVVKIQLYSIKNPEQIITLIISTKPILKPTIFGSLVIAQNKKDSIFGNQKKAYEEIITNYHNLPLNNQSDVNADDNISGGRIFLKTNNSPYLYNFYIIKKGFGFDDSSYVYPLLWEKLSINEVKNMYSTNITLDSSEAIYTSAVPLQLVPKNRGSYKIISVYRSKVNVEQSDPIVFTIGPDRAFIKNRVVPIAMLVITLLTLLSSVILFFKVKKKQKGALAKVQQKTEEARLRLQSIRSQLNPHFVYNALAGIQNLLYKQENEKANSYLTKFSRLSRKVLEDPDNDLIAIYEEAILLEDYLQMEQMRFGFEYEISIDDKIDKQNVEIPVMLIQPFVENAVKHGMVSLAKKGKISVAFHKENKSIIIMVKDNGTGFNPEQQNKGMGTSLSENRISLLNELYKTTPIELNTQSGTSGTMITITLNDWLA